MSPNRGRLLRKPSMRIAFFASLVTLLLLFTFRSYGAVVQSQFISAPNSDLTILQSFQQPIREDARKHAPRPATDTDHHAIAFKQSRHQMDCGRGKDHLKKLKKKYKLSADFEYYKRYVKVSQGATERLSVTRLDQNLMTDETKVASQKDVDGDATCPDPLLVSVVKSPDPSTADLSDFMFGVSTTYSRFKNPATTPVNEWAYWLTSDEGKSNGGKLLLMLVGAKAHQLADAEKTLVEMGIDAEVYHSDPRTEMAVRYLALVPTMYNHTDRAHKKWLVLCDDDTFFPYPNSLVARFARYDASQLLYVGTFSEDVNNIGRHGAQAFGGAGVFLSMPMARRITESLDTCKTDEKIKESNSGWGPQGDILLRKCIYENSETKLTALWGLWQLDLCGDASGFYEAGIKPLSLHHYRGGMWHTAFPLEGAKMAHVCGEDCTFQRFQTADDFIISAGYSIAQYPKGIDVNLDQIERTFGAAPEDKGWNFDYMLGPQRKSLSKTGRKMAWTLKEGIYDPDENIITQIYIRKEADERWRTDQDTPMATMDGVIELVWIV